MSYVCETFVPTFSLQERIERSIIRSNDDVFVRDDFKRLGGYDQIGRALRALVKNGVLVKAGYGVYVRARASSLTGNPVPAISLTEIGFQALSKLGVEAEVGEAARKYRGGETSQMPMAIALSVRGSRISRKIGIGERSIKYERAPHFRALPKKHRAAKTRRQKNFLAGLADVRDNIVKVSPFVGAKRIKTAMENEPEWESDFA